MTPALPAALRALLERIEKAEGPDRQIDLDLWNGLTGEKWEWMEFDPLLRMGKHEIARWQHDEVVRLLADGHREEAFLISRPGEPFETRMGKPLRLTASLNAAVALVERVLPGWDWSIDRDGAKMGDVIYFASVHEVRPDFLARCRMETADSPALALCLALCRALFARADAGQGDGA